ncbi:MAG: nucleotide sugar dehydrogenase [Candidatus Gottesmanbacteria bacterium GW2011_GWA2_43_14]|uniref:Nucleotide sugar dehydrogenase n=1 Tax=Candidatus Gottesmanbacteria bacterium GW2011_GWA2_43_14 TaxID=1618443 RepID=A0A0G1DJ36_9BACT|nr:MAG: nucleotide sugar dehydrogenase [Candidatus Gottesmanbacteria bacterium GW2011_GWA2_43_14]
MSEKELKGKIKNKTVLVGIVGVGYVGEALAYAITNKGFHTVGFEIDQSRITFLKNKQIPRFTITSNKNLLKDCQVILISIPTPLLPDKSPDLSYLKQAVLEVSQRLSPGKLVVIESSVAPGTTADILQPILESSHLKAEKDFYLAYSPERVDPGNRSFNVNSIPKVVSGIGPLSLSLASAFYRQIVEKVVPVSNTTTAEMTKVLENVFRLVNISLVNELVEYAKALKINMWEVIDAAATKPFGFLAHYPGPGAGGYCIPVLPMYLLESARKKNIRLPLVETAEALNDHQPEKVAGMALNILNGKKEDKNHPPKALLIGISYKADLADTRESVALKIWRRLEDEGVEVYYHDPYVSKLNGSTSVNLDPGIIKDMNLIIITTPHKNIPYETLVSSDKPLFDTQNVLSNFHNGNIIRL